MQTKKDSEKKNMSEDFTILPDNLPQPFDDGSANHLLGRQIPDVILPSTKNSFFGFVKY